MLEKAGAVPDGIKDGLTAQHCPDRLIAAAEPLGNGDDIRADRIGLGGKEMAGAPHAAHHLIKDQQHTVTVTNVPDALKITFFSRHRAQRCPDNRLGDKGKDIFSAEAVNLRFQLVGHRRP